MAEKKDKVGVLRWKGLLSGQALLNRSVVLGMLALLCISLTFTQLGFAKVELADQQCAYVMFLLVPVVLGSLLLGTGVGSIVGVFAGCVMLLHANIMPLDSYELEFVSPVSSIGLLFLSAFFAGVFFALLFRKERRMPVKVVGIILVAAIISWLYSIGFSISVTAGLISYVLDNNLVSDGTVSEKTLDQLKVIQARTGDIGLQTWINCLLIMAISFAAMAASEHLGRISNSRPNIRYLFNTRLAEVVLAAFMFSATLAFIAISVTELYTAEQRAEEEVDFILEQLKDSVDNTEQLITILGEHGLFDDAKMTDEEWSSLNSLTSKTDLVGRYSVEDDGAVFVTYRGEDEDADMMVWLTNVDYEQKADGNPPWLSDFLLPDARKTVNECIENGNFGRIVYDYSYHAPSSDRDEFVLDGDLFMRTGLSYVKSKSNGNYSVTFIVPATDVYAERDLMMLAVTLVVLVMLAGVFLLTSRMLRTTIVERIRETNGVLSSITAGDLEAKVEVYDTAEFSDLSDDINETVDALKGWITEAETRIDAEMANARAIQESSLPGIFPPFPNISEFDIFASMKAAKEVGGDFYDFFLIGDGTDAESGKVAFVIADVSGKGYVGALFMMKAKTQIRDYLESGASIAEAIGNANDMLCEGNDAGMFVTAWIGILDYGPLELEYVNAGHNPPLLFRVGEGWSWLTEKSGLPLGLFAGMPYEVHSMQCCPGDKFLLYTDGVTEAMNPSDELYGEERLMKLLEANSGLHPKELITAVREGVVEHAAGAEQSDDITMLALEVSGASGDGESDGKPSED